MAKALAKFKFRRLSKRLYGNKRFRYVRYCTLSEVRDYWRNNAGGDTQ
jgi:hypothetical protein